MAEKKAVGVVNIARRTWDKDEYERKAREREELGSDEEIQDRKRPKIITNIERAPATARTSEVGVDKKLGQKVVITEKTAESQKGGFYCDVCDCAIKDSAGWLDHINGKKHQRAMGTSLQSERATLSQVKNRLKMHTQKRKDMEDSKNVFQATTGYALDEIIQKREEEERQAKEEKKLRKKQQKEAERGVVEPEVDPETAAMAQMMGLPMGFGGGK